MTPPTEPRPALPRTVWALGFTSLFMDLSSEMIHGLLPILVVVGLGASATVLGILEGVAEATAQIVKVFSGWLSDRIGRRKALAVAGYGLAALTKPFFPLADSVSTVMAARFADRIGKGIRGAPRDALVADVTPPAIRGAAFGLRQSLDTVGAAIGPLLAILLMMAFAGDVRTVLWFAAIPAFIAVAILVVAVRETPAPTAAEPRPPIRIADLAGLGRSYRLLLLLAALFTMARFSEAFLVIRAADAGLSVVFAPVVIAIMSIVYAVNAYPAGLVQDRAGPRGLLAASLGVLVAAHLVLAFADGPATVLVGTAFWGLHMGLSQGVLSALVAEAAPAHLRGTAFGMFNLVSGVVTLAASVAAGLLWDAAGPSATFLAGAAWAGLAGLGVALLPRGRAA